MSAQFILNGEDLTPQQLYKLSLGGMKLTLHADTKARMQKSRDYIMGRVAAGEVIYGVNTGFGAFSSVRISDEEIEALQRNLIRSHCCGVGAPFSIEETRAILVLRANALCRGHSGIRIDVVEKILEFYNHDILPVIPSQGSVGASGDLAPLSHLGLSLMGEGQVWAEGHTVATSSLLKKMNVAPLVLKAKEGLSIINGCQVMTAVGGLALERAAHLMKLMDVAGSMTLEALKGSRSAFDPLISATRPHRGESITAKNILKVLGETSEIAESHLNCSKVQDAYSLRCIPAVHGAAKDTIHRSLETLKIEMNSSTDNPLVFSDENKILSCGNFHGEPVAFALDFAAIALSASSNMSECRIQKLVNPAMSELPAFLAKNGGLQSGLMIVQVAAASLVSENKILSHPASVDSIPTSADKEDHVSMGTISARKFKSILENAENILAMELLTAAQALDFLKPLSPNKGVKAAYDLIRSEVPFANEDRVFASDIGLIRSLIQSEKLLQSVEKEVGPLDL